MVPFERKRRWRSPKHSAALTGGRGARTRFTLLRLTVLVVFAILSLQLARLQLLNGAAYRQRAEVQRLSLVPVPAPRGLIYDRNGQLLVENIPSFALAIIPANVPSGEAAERLYRRLESLCNQPATEIRLKVEDGRRTKNPFQPLVLKRDLTWEEAAQFLEQRSDLPGVELLIEPTRHYLEGPLFSHILGFVRPISAEEYAQLKDRGYQMDDRIGKTGVELTYETALRGIPGKRMVEKDVLGREVAVVAEEPPRPGHSLVLAIDADLQRKTAEILASGMGRSRTAAAIVMDVRTGEILAMVSLPTFDNNVFSSTVRDDEIRRLLEDPAKPLVNHSITEMYPPGSIFKEITGVAALQERVATPTTTITSRGFVTVPDEFVPGKAWVLPDWAVLGTLDFYRGVAMSSDVYFYCLVAGCGPMNGQPESVKGMGPTALARYARAFGLGSETGVDLPGETAGIMPDPAWKKEVKAEAWNEGDNYNMAIGQGDVATTPLQMLVVTAAIANGGDVLAPRVVREIRDINGNIVQPFQRIVRNRVPVEPQHLATMREAMRQAVARGTARPAGVPGVPVAGKTGTAEFGPPLANGKHATHGWFTGFAPADNPEIAVIVFLEQGVGQENAAPLGGRILQYYFERQSFARGR